MGWRDHGLGCPCVGLAMDYDGDSRAGHGLGWPLAGLSLSWYCHGPVSPWCGLGMG
jgi:hypothetical protein